MRQLFNPRVAFKPFEYPEVTGYRDAINHSFWLVSEWNFIADQGDFSQMTPLERRAIRNTLLAISQIEVSVKKFWAQLGGRIPKAEFDQVGITFGESEVRHAEAYSHLLTVLHLNEDFEQILEVPAIRGRVDYLAKFMKGASACSDQEYALTLTLFSSFIENVSLFAQFVIIKSFNKHRQVLKDIDNVVSATQKEELIHAAFGQYVVNTIRSENPGWFGTDFYIRLEEAAHAAYKAERAILDWIFEAGELPWLSKAALDQFIRQRLNESLTAVGADTIFVVDQALLGELTWFYEELHAGISVDFFHVRSVDYSKKQQAVQAGDLF
jgi:ribonucleoside-diphosphate reductase beta chain